jgi:hypothetical protein
MGSELTVRTTGRRSRGLAVVWRVRFGMCVCACCGEGRVAVCVSLSLSSVWGCDPRVAARCVCCVLKARTQTVVCASQGVGAACLGSVAGGGQCCGALVSGLLYS